VSNTIKDRAKELGKLIQSLVDDAMEAGEDFTVSFKAPGPGWERYYGEERDTSKQSVGFSLTNDEDYDEDDEGNEVVVNCWTTSPNGAWYSSSVGC
jgi:hypothetical protein